ncbi:MAG: glycosyltransferase, partial [Candidatus Coatesbacteria bacterium]|nr:glycosyltransferase [Candidatus Coatesbacteria bacterium]
MADIKGRVVRIVSDLPYGGVERRLLTILPRLKDLGWEVSVMCIREAGQMAELFEQAGIRVDVIPFRSRWSPLSLKQLARWLKDNRIDIVHTHMYRCNTSGTVAARLARVKGVISNVHNVNEWDNLHQLFVDRMLARYKDRIIAVSEGVRQNYLEKTRIPTEKVITIHNGVDLKPFQDVPCNRELAAELGIEDGDRVISVFARLVEQKRHIDFLEMAAIVLKTIPNARFMIFGKGKLRDELENTAAELGIAGRVVFAGHRSDIPDLLALTDVVVMCSDKEGFSNALLESMAAGVPTVATDVGGNAEAIVDGDSGFIVPTRQPEVLADRVLRLLKD